MGHGRVKRKNPFGAMKGFSLSLVLKEVYYQAVKTINVFFL
jgi:hypothetical protein